MNIYTYLIYSTADGGIFDSKVLANTPEQGYGQALAEFAIKNGIGEYKADEFELVACIKGDVYFEYVDKVKLFPGC